MRTTTSGDPRDKPLLYHRAAKIAPNGHVSALCYSTPRAIPLDKRERWTLIGDSVTCPKCRKLQRGAAK